MRGTAVVKNAKAKGSRAERRCVKILEASGYLCTKAGGSLGLFDVVAIRGLDVQCIASKAGNDLSERPRAQANGAAERAGDDSRPFTYLRQGKRNRVGWHVARKASAWSPTMGVCLHAEHQFR